MAAQNKQVLLKTSPRRRKLCQEVARSLRHRPSHIAASSLLVVALGAQGTAWAESELALEEVIVTAQKRAQDLQDVPISVQALSAEALESLNIQDFDDYVAQLPSVSYFQRRPGQGSLFMRGISEGGNSNQSLQGPAVAIYLDEQPVSAIGLNLDVHIYDVERIEALAGPQGTLYGAASEAGNLRILTRQPSADGFEGGFDLALESTSGGDPSYTAEGFVNIPLGDRAALRLVGWYDQDGGYIDAVPDTITFPYSGITVGNDKWVRSNFNESRKAGARAALKIDLNDSWTATASAILQSTDTDGVWDHDPENLGDFKVGRFFDDRQEDDWTKLGLTVEGDLGFADLVYAGSYLDRDYEIYSDYSHYSISGFVEPYYTCYVSYFGPCVDPSIQFINETSIKYQTHELRLSSKQEQRLRWIVGAFYMDNKTAYDSQWSIPPINPGAAVRDDLYFETDQVRKDSETALFGELYYDFTDQLTATFGYRWFDDETSLKGFVGTVWWPTCCFAFGPRPPDNVNSKFSGSDDIVKFSLAYQATGDLMFYGTYSQGYRPGGANRTEQLGATYEPDFLDNFELGMKSTWFDGRMRLNGAVYYMDWDDVQIGFFNPDISLLGLVDNIGAAESKGMELDLTALLTENLEVSVAWAYNNAELTENYFSRDSNVTPDAFDGQDLPFTPDNKFTFTGKYNFSVAEMPAYAQFNYSYTDSMWNSIFFSSREEMDDYGIANASVGVNTGRWNAELYVSNLTDEVAELYINTADIQRLVTVNRPRTFGVRMGMRFD